MKGKDVDGFVQVKANISCILFFSVFALMHVACSACARTNMCFGQVHTQSSSYIPHYYLLVPVEVRDIREEH